MNKKIIAEIVKIADQLDKHGLHHEADETTSILTQLLDDPFEWGDDEKSRMIEQPTEHGTKNLQNIIDSLSNIPVIPLYQKSLDDRIEGEKDIVDSIFNDHELKKAVSLQSTKQIQKAAADLSVSLKQKYGVDIEIKISKTMREFYATTVGDKGLRIVIGPDRLFNNRGLDKLQTWIDSSLLKMKIKSQKSDPVPPRNLMS
jgi:hypothetical protein